MKTFVKLFALIVMFSLLASCGGAATEPPVTDSTESLATEPPATEVPLSVAEQWAKDNEVGPYQPAEDDWAAIEAAAKAEGKIVVYSNSSRIITLAELWAAAYPDITIEAYDLGGAEVVSKVREEQKAGAYTGDVWANAQGPDMEGEFLPNQYLWKFIPNEYLSVISEENQNPVVTSSTEVFGWIYNTELNPDGCPISNWWELADEAWYGKIFIKDPTVSAEDLGLLMSAIRNADDFAAAYEALYGTTWDTDPAVDADTPDAGWLWLKKFAQNAPTGVGGSDDVWGAMAVPGLTENKLGWAPYSKYRKVISGDAVFSPCLDMTPVTGVQKHNYLAVINQAPHPNAAKLFIKFALSEEAFAPYNQVGQYSGRSDVTPVEDALPFVGVSVYNFDNQFIYNNITAYHDFYVINLLAP